MCSWIHMFVDNSQAFSTTFSPVGVLGSLPNGCKCIITAKNSVKCHDDALASFHSADPSTSTRRLNVVENAHKFSNKHADLCSWIQQDGGYLVCVFHKVYPRGSTGSLPNGNLQVIIMAKNSVKCALATIHKDLHSQAKPFENAHKFSNKHVDSCAQIAGRWITHKHFPQRTRVGVLGSAEWKLVRIIMAKNSVKWQMCTCNHSQRPANAG